MSYRTVLKLLKNGDSDGWTIITPTKLKYESDNTIIYFDKINTKFLGFLSLLIVDNGRKINISLFKRYRIFKAVLNMRRKIRYMINFGTHPYYQIYPNNRTTPILSTSTLTSEGIGWANQTHLRYDHWTAQPIFTSSNTTFARQHLGKGDYSLIDKKIEPENKVNKTNEFKKKLIEEKERVHNILLRSRNKTNGS
jgi:hypothetical protein